MSIKTITFPFPWKSVHIFIFLVKLKLSQSRSQTLTRKSCKTQSRTSIHFNYFRFRPIHLVKQKVSKSTYILTCYVLTRNEYLNIQKVKMINIIKSKLNCERKNKRNCPRSYLQRRVCSRENTIYVLYLHHFLLHMKVQLTQVKQALYSQFLATGPSAIFAQKRTQCIPVEPPNLVITFWIFWNIQKTKFQTLKNQIT